MGASFRLFFDPVQSLGPICPCRRQAVGFARVNLPNKCDTSASLRAQASSSSSSAGSHGGISPESCPLHPQQTPRGGWTPRGARFRSIEPNAESPGSPTVLTGRVRCHALLAARVFGSGQIGNMCDLDVRPAPKPGRMGDIRQIPAAKSTNQAGSATSRQAMIAGHCDR